MLLLLLLLPGLLLVMLRVLERYERMIDAPPKKPRGAPPLVDQVTLVAPPTLPSLRVVPAVEPAPEPA